MAGSLMQTGSASLADCAAWGQVGGTRLPPAIPHLPCRLRVPYHPHPLPHPPACLPPPPARLAPAWRQVYMSEVAIFTDYKLDESYTPTKISVRVGNTFGDLREVGAAASAASTGCVFACCVRVGNTCGDLREVGAAVSLRRAEGWVAGSGVGVGLCGGMGSVGSVDCVGSGQHLRRSERGGCCSAAFWVRVCILCAAS